TVPLFADWAVIDLIEDDRIVRLAAVHADPKLAELAKIVEEFPAERSNTAQDAPSQVLISKKSLLIPEFTEEMLKKSAKTPEHEAVIRKIDPKSVIVVPLVCREKMIGVLSMATCGSRRRFDAQDLALAEELARR